MVAEWFGGRTAAETAGTMDDPPAKLRAEFVPEDLRQDYMRALYAYWKAARGSEPLPALGAIDPLRLPTEALPHMAVMEVQSPLRFRSRLVGTRIVQAVGLDQTRRYTDELPGAADQIRRMTWCVKTQMPYLVEDTITFSARDYKSYQALGLPFGDSDAGVQRLVFVFDFKEAVQNSGGD